MSTSVAVVPLGDAVKPTRPRVKPKDFPGLPFIGMEHIEAHSMKLLGTVPAKTMKSSAVHFKPGDVLYGRLRPYLNKVYRPNFEGLCSAEFIVLSENDRIDGAYLQYFLNSGAFVRYATRLNAGDRPRVDFDQLAAYKIPLPEKKEQRSAVAEIEKQFSRLDEALAQIERAKINLERYKRAMIQGMTTFGGRSQWSESTIGELAQSLDHMRRPVNKLERARRGGEIPYLGANGRTGWIDQYLFDEELVLVVEDETFVGRTTPFSYFFSGKCWVNNHAHILRVRPEKAIAKYLAFALSYYPFTPLTTGSTGRRKLTKKALMDASLKVPELSEQRKIVADVERRLSVIGAVKTEIDANHERAERLRQAVLHRAYIVNC